MRENKPFASLSSGLLARKGGAKPAMRPQGFNSFGGSLEDLGWDDMGQSDEPLPEHVPSPVTALTPSPGAMRHTPIHPAPHAADQHSAPIPAPTQKPAVVEQQISLRESFAEPAEVVELPRRRAALPGVKAKAAFTLRLDPERHLKLRLASAITRCSAQQLVTAALDDFLQTLPDLDTLADRVPAEAGKRR